MKRVKGDEEEGKIGEEARAENEMKEMKGEKIEMFGEEWAI